MRVFLMFCVLSMMACGPMAKFTYHQTERAAPSEIQFKNESKKADSYMWDFGDGNTSEEVDPVHHYRLSGKYKIQLKAKKGSKVSTYSKDMLVEAPTDCLVLIETAMGNITVKLFDDTPLHRDNFIKLVQNGFYDDLLFHRVIENFMIQGGDPNSKSAPSGKSLGSGGPGYQIPAEILAANVHTRGALAAARTSDQVNPERKSSGSQFYIVHGNTVSESTLDQMEDKLGIQYSEEQRKTYLEQGGTPFLDMSYTVFGQVVEGFDVIEAIAKTQKDNRDRPKSDVSMKMHIVK